MHQYTPAVFAIVIVLLLSNFAAAQEPPQESTAAADQTMTLMEMIKVGGWTMWPLGFCSIVGIGLALYNAVVVRGRKLLNPGAVAEINRALAALDIDAARAKCRATPCMITNVIGAGLERIKGEIHLSSVEKGMEEASMEEIGSVLVPINYISAVAVIAPMLGLLGTVSGMISAFRNMALGGMGRPELLADDISQALITTATGLIIGIPVMVAYLYYKNKFTTIVASMNKTVGNLLETLATAIRHYQSAPATACQAEESGTAEEPTEQA